MFVAIINDCRDENAMGRQKVRVASLLGGPVATIGVKHELEAAGCLVDVLDAADGKEGVVLVNVAPRHGPAKKWPNGSPFGYFYHQSTLVLASLDGYTLSLIKKLGRLPLIHPLDIAAVVEVIAKKGVTIRKKSQFRSFDFLPYAAKVILDGLLDHNIANHISPETIPDSLKAIWYIDCFGNAKTTLLPKDVNFSPNTVIDTKVGSLPCFARLADVPDNEAALIIGSSGIGDERFLEIVIQGGKAAKALGLKVGQVIL